MVFGFSKKKATVVTEPKPVVPEKPLEEAKAAESQPDIQPVLPKAEPTVAKTGTIDRLEDQLGDLLNQVENLKESLITEVQDRKTGLLSDLSAKKLDEFSLQSDLGVQKKLISTFEKNKAHVESKKNQDEAQLADLREKMQEMQEEIDSVDKRIDRLHRLIDIDQEKIDLKQANHYVDRELLQKVKERKGTLVSVEQERKILGLDMEILQQKEKQLLDMMAQENSLLDTMASDISLDIDKHTELSNKQAEEHQKLTESIQQIASEKEKMDSKLEKLIGRKKYIIEKNSKNVDFGVILPNLPANLQAEEAASLQVWNNIIHAGAHLHLFSIEMNPEAKSIYEGYMKRGIFNSAMEYHNVYFDLLEWDDQAGQFSNNFYADTKNEGENVTPIITASGMRVGIRRVDGNTITEEFRNPVKNHRIIYKYVDQQLDNVVYDDFEFASEKEFLTYWMTKVSDNKKIRLVVSSNSELPVYDPEFAKEGIMIIPLIMDADDLANYRPGNLPDELNEVLVFGDKAIDRLAEKVNRDTVVYKLPDTMVSPEMPEKTIVLPEVQ